MPLIHYKEGARQDIAGVPTNILLCVNPSLQILLNSLYQTTELEIDSLIPEFLEHLAIPWQATVINTSIS